MLTDNDYGKFKYILYRPEGGGGLPLVVAPNNSGENRNLPNGKDVEL